MNRLIKSFSGKGFSLVEVMIAVTIIGLLTTVGIPTFSRLVQRAKSTEAKIWLGTIATLEETFYAQNGGYTVALDSLELDTINGLTPMGRPKGSQNYYVIGFPNSSDCSDGLNGGIGFGQSVYYPTSGADMYNAYCLIASISMRTYVATASGVVAPGVAINTMNSSQVDQWSINQNGYLDHVVDGSQ